MDENSIRTLSGIASSPAPTRNSKQSTTQTDAEGANFQQLLAAMMLASTLSNSNSSSGSGSLLGGDMFSPILFSLIEKMMAQQSGSETANQATLLSANGEPQGMPVSGGRLTQEYRAGHAALDFGVPVGTPVRSTMDGKVVYAGWNDQGYGNLVIVENGDFRTYYAHLSSIPVAVGDVVTAQSVIGLSGNTGNSTGPHLHYEIRRNGQAIDPTSQTLG